MTLAALPDPEEVVEPFVIEAWKKEEAAWIETEGKLMNERDELAAEILKFQSRCAVCGRLYLDHQPCEQCRAALKRIEEPDARAGGAP